MAKRSFSQKRKPIAKDCFFCQNNAQPDYKNIETLNNFITERKKIASREYTGVCAKHQRKLARAIKQARHLALIPFVSQIH
ncbi:MAG: 30S ribosomal protein S18 [Candidatus Shapirobacteria bacterium]|nr:30S ribosomal protein S18 [Candidatus Shapirobacteria bacterium]MDD5073763.1 30S ribosomal protein S18 [Candidatus Shapirobacteria bacterium]MDD5481636.1 30S ribosomal protein S18 [Candidatus Shapirobacteria bacterium]